MSFHTEDFHPPRVTVTSDPDSTSGDIFLTPKHVGSHFHFQRGPMILDSQGRLVWFAPVNGKITNLEVQRYHGRPVLTWWESRGKGQRAFDVILNRSYQTVAALHAHGARADSHEFQITPQGTALIDAVVSAKANLTAVGGPANGTVSDCVIQELDIKTGKLLWQWHALRHIPLSASYAIYKGGRYDYLHLNSIQQLPNRNLLISGRNTWAVYEIDRHTGKVIWTLGGKNSSFSLGSGARFEWQHDAHLDNNTLSVFDDASNGPQQQAFQSSAEVLRLNLAARTAALVHRYYHHPPLIASSQGSAQLLPNGNMFVGWGDQPDFSEYRPDGQQIFNGSFPFGAQSYRAYRFRWEGDPLTKPSLALNPQPGGSVKVYASWNGATRVVSWRVLGGPDRHHMTRLSERKRTGFETELKPHSEPAYFEVQALGDEGHVLASSFVHPDPPHLAIFAPEIFVRGSTGGGGVAAGCFTRKSCHLRVRVSAGGAVLGGGARPVARGAGALIPFKLSRAGLSKLRRARDHRLAVQVAVHDSASGATATRRMTLISYSIAGKGPTGGTLGSKSLQFVQGAGFVSATTGRGQILAACYAAVPCRIRVTVAARGRPIAHSAPEQLGVDELGPIYFKLTSAGRAMLRRARGNQLPARITLADGSGSSSGNFALVGYR